MSNELNWRDFTRIKLKGHLKNITENTIETIDTKAIKNKNSIIYSNDQIKHTVKLNKQKPILIRESNEFNSIMSFQMKKITNCEYTLKEQGISIEIPIETKNIIFTDQLFQVDYTVCDSQFEYTYCLEMSDIDEYKN